MLCLLANTVSDYIEIFMVQPNLGCMSLCVPFILSACVYATSLLYCISTVIEDALNNNKPKLKKQKNDFCFPFLFLFNRKKSFVHWSATHTTFCLVIYFIVVAYFFNIHSAFMVCPYVLPSIRPSVCIFVILNSKRVLKNLADECNLLLIVLVTSFVIVKVIV